MKLNTELHVELGSKESIDVIEMITVIISCSRCGEDILNVLSVQAASNLSFVQPDLFIMLHIALVLFSFFKFMQPDTSWTMMCQIAKCYLIAHVF